MSCASVMVAPQFQHRGETSSANLLASSRSSGVKGRPSLRLAKIFPSWAFLTSKTWLIRLAPTDLRGFPALLPLVSQERGKGSGSILTRPLPLISNGTLLLCQGALGPRSSRCSGCSLRLLRLGFDSVPRAPFLASV